MPGRTLVYPPTHNKPLVTHAADASGALTDPKVLGPAVVMQGTFAARPAAALAGRLYLATDIGGGTFYRDTGAAWVQVGASAAAAASGWFQDVTTSIASGASLSKTVSTSVARSFCLAHHKRQGGAFPAMLVLGTTVAGLEAAGVGSVGAAGGTAWGASRALDTYLNSNADHMAGTNVQLQDVYLSGTDLVIKYYNGDAGAQLVATKVTWVAAG